MKFTIKLVHKDTSVLEFEVDEIDKLAGAAVITRNGRYYVYMSTGEVSFQNICFAEVEQPYAVEF